MSILNRVREKFQTPLAGTSKTSKSPSAGSAGCLPTHCEPVNLAEDVPLSPVQQTARSDVLSQLKAHPQVRVVLSNRFDPDGTLVVTLGIRDIGTGELRIPADRFSQETLDDYAALLDTIKGSA